MTTKPLTQRRRRFFIANLCAMFLAAMTTTSGAEPVPTSADDEPEAGTEIVHPVDGAIMVYVPSGVFIMGLSVEEANQVALQLGYENYEEPWMWECFPRRRESISGFFIDKYEVSIGRWRGFLKANPEFEPALNWLAKYGDDSLADVLPAESIRWAEAQKYANWAGKQLPDERQWEKAARGSDGRFFPWGNEFDPARGHFQGEALPKWQNRKVYTRIGRYPQGASPYGVMDMLGNQYEWTSAWLEPYPNNPERHRMRSYTGHQNACLRGGSWYHGKAGFYAAKRFGLRLDETHFHVGFRTVWQPPQGYFESPEFQAAKEEVESRCRKLQERFDEYDRALLEKAGVAEDQ